MLNKRMMMSTSMVADCWWWGGYERCHHWYNLIIVSMISSGVITTDWDWPKAHSDNNNCIVHHQVTPGDTSHTSHYAAAPQIRRKIFQQNWKYFKPHRTTLSLATCQPVSFRHFRQTRELGTRTGNRVNTNTNTNTNHQTWMRSQLLLQRINRVLSNCLTPRVFEINNKY